MDTRTIALAAAFACTLMAATCLAQGLLIIMPDAFADEIAPLARFKDASCRPTYTVNLTTVYTTWSGTDQPERVKRCIEYYERNLGIDTVLLVGDCDVLPVRYCCAYNTEWGTKWYPSDLYYSDLYDAGGAFDDWDGNNNGVHGEMDFLGNTDMSLVNLDSIDMHPDVAVGRVPASTEAEVSTYVQKVLDYELKAPGSWFSTAVMAVDGGAAPFGDETKMDEDVVPHLTGVGATVLKRYMDWAPYNTMTGQQRMAEMNNRFNAGAGFVNFYGHGNRLLWDGWYDDTGLSGLANEHMLPVVFATACYTARFHVDREYYWTAAGSQWSRLGQPTPPTTYPKPAAVQPSAYDSYGGESLAEEFLVKRLTGAIGYIGATSKGEHGMWLSDPTRSIGMAPYFFESYASAGGAGRASLGSLWSQAMARFVIDVESIGMYYYAFVHIHKVLLLGDPSVVVGGAFATAFSGAQYDWPAPQIGPLYPLSRYRVTGDITVPAGFRLTAQYYHSFLFESGRKLVAYDTSPLNGFMVNASPDLPVNFMTLSADPQVSSFMRGVRITGQMRLRNGGALKLQAGP